MNSFTFADLQKRYEDKCADHVALLKRFRALEHELTALPALQDRLNSLLPLIRDL
jgi:hypothetical protein